MKNSELLTVQRRNLTPTEKQQQFVLRSLIQQNACPNCGHRLNFFEGAAIDLDDWEDKSGLTACKCTACKRALEYVVPVIAGTGNGGWHWRLVQLTASELPPDRSDG